MGTYEDVETDLQKFLQPVNQWPQYSGYQPLSRQHREIRLLEISHVPETGQICASVRHVSLARDDLVYAALSYCWGPPDELRAIFIDGEKVFIRRSLHSFLTVLGESEAQMPIWFDSVCINQSDPDERSSQVRLMGEIYSSATYVHVWLGDSTPDSEYFLSYVQHRDSPVLQASSYYDEHRRKAQGSLADIAQRPYWKRLWIIQEISLATTVSIWCGHRRVAWTQLLAGIQDLKIAEYDHMLHAINAIAASRDELPLQDMGMSKLGFAFASNAPSRRESTTSLGLASLRLLDLVKHFKDQKCEDVRDRIYGLVSIAVDGKEFEIDYRKTIAEVITELVGLHFESPKRNATRRQFPFAIEVRELWTYLSLGDTSSFFTTPISNDTFDLRSSCHGSHNTRQLLSSFLLPWSEQYLRQGIGGQMLDTGSLFLPSMIDDWPDVDDLLFQTKLHPGEAGCVPSLMLVVLRLEKGQEGYWVRVVGCISGFKWAPHFLHDRSLGENTVRDRVQMCGQVAEPISNDRYIEIERYLNFQIHHNKAFQLSMIGEHCGKPQSRRLLPISPIQTSESHIHTDLILNLCECKPRMISREAAKAWRQEIIRGKENVTDSKLKLIKEACSRRKQEIVKESGLSALSTNTNEQGPSGLRNWTKRLIPQG